MLLPHLKKKKKKKFFAMDWVLASKGHTCLGHIHKLCLDSNLIWLYSERNELHVS